MFELSYEIELEGFKAWGGATDRLARIIELGIEEEASDYIKEMAGAELSESLLNDILWFEMDDFIEEHEEE